MLSFSRPLLFGAGAGADLVLLVNALNLGDQVDEKRAAVALGFTTTTRWPILGLSAEPLRRWTSSCPRCRYQ